MSTEEGLSINYDPALVDAVRGSTSPTTDLWPFFEAAAPLPFAALRGGRLRYPDGRDRLGGSICGAIVTPRPGDLTSRVMLRLCGPGLVVTETECLRAMALTFLHLKLAIEPGGAVALAAALWHRDAIRGDRVVAVASDRNVDPSMFARALAPITG